jgi:hypothetical protein
MATVDDVIEQAADDFEVVQRRDQVRLFANGGRGNRIDWSTTVVQPDRVMTGITLDEEETLYMSEDGTVDTGSAYASLRHYLFNADFHESRSYKRKDKIVKWFEGPYRLDPADTTVEENPLQETLSEVHRRTKEHTMLVSPLMPYSVNS